MSEEVKNMQNGGDEELFEKLNAEKKRKRRRTIRVALIILLAVFVCAAQGAVGGALPSAARDSATSRGLLPSVGTRRVRKAP